MRSDDAVGRSGATGQVHLIGNVNLDLVVGPVVPWPVAGTERIVERREARVGGAAGVAAMALQALGTPFRLHARIGDDAFGDLVRREMGAAGAQLEVVRAPTGTSVGLTHPHGERTFFTELGHLGALDTDAVAVALERSEPGWVLVCGTFLLPSLRGDGGRRLLRRARDAGHRLLFDSGWPSEGFDSGVRGELDALLPLVDMVLPNEAEARAWAATDDLPEAMRRLERAGGRAVVKRGAAGASWLERGDVRTASAPALVVADTVGAGDAFNAALLVVLQAGGPLPVAVSRAVGYASRVAATAPRRYPEELPPA
ncbi:MAG: carbohydrate kinase family protein [Deinococcales bacterium]